MAGAGFENDLVFAANADFSGAALPAITNGLALDGQLWIGRTAVNAGGTHVDVATLTAGTGIIITNGSGTITIAANGSVVGETITGNTGGPLNPTAGNWNIVTANTTVLFAGSGSTLTQDFSKTNLVLGTLPASITSANNNVGVGTSVLFNITSAFSNIAMGSGALFTQQTGNQNVALGANAMNGANGVGNTVAVGYGALSASLTGSNNTGCGYQALALTTSGTNNAALGYGSLAQITSGQQNVGIGYFAGHAYTSSEANNICIGYNVTGTIGESNICRLGNSSITDTYFQGNAHLPQGQLVNVTRPGAYPYNILATDYVISVDTSSAANQVNLPGSPVQGQVFIVKDRSANAATNNITVSGNGHNIVGVTSASTQVIVLNGAAVTYVFDTSVWLAV